MVRRRRQLLPKELARRRRKLFLWKAAALGFLSILLLIGFVYLMRNDSLRIDTVTTASGNWVSAEEMQELAMQELSKKFLFVLPRDNFLFLSKGAIKSAVLDKYHEIDSVSVTRDGITGITVSFTERVPSAVWCEKKWIVEESKNRSCYLVDSVGYIFKRDDFARIHSAALPFYDIALEKDTVNPVGSYVLPTSLYTAIMRETDVLEDLGFILSRVYRHEVQDFGLEFENGVRAYIPSDDSLAGAMENLSLVITSDVLVQEHMTEYIDLRFGNKVFYKEE